MISVSMTSRKIDAMTRLCGRPQSHGTVVVFASYRRNDAAVRAERGESDM